MCLKINDSHWVSSRSEDCSGRDNALMGDQLSPLQQLHYPLPENKGDGAKEILMMSKDVSISKGRLMWWSSILHLIRPDIHQASSTPTYRHSMQYTYSLNTLRIGRTTGRQGLSKYQKYMSCLPENQHLGWVRVTFLGDFSSLSWAYFLCKWAKF